MNIQKKQLILNQYKSNKYYILDTELTKKEHFQFIKKLINDDNLDCIF